MLDDGDLAVKQVSDMQEGLGAVMSALRHFMQESGGCDNPDVDVSCLHARENGLPEARLCPWCALEQAVGEYDRLREELSGSRVEPATIRMAREFNALVGTMNERLRSMYAVTAAVDISGGGKLWWRRHEQKAKKPIWRLMLSQGQGQQSYVPLENAPMKERAVAVDHLDALVEALDAASVKVSSEMERATKSLASKIEVLRRRASPTDE